MRFGVGVRAVVEELAGPGARRGKTHRPTLKWTVDPRDQVALEAVRRKHLGASVIAIVLGAPATAAALADEIPRDVRVRHCPVFGWTGRVMPSAGMAVAQVVQQSGIDRLIVGMGDPVDPPVAFA